jgi:hydroxyethylthiazole kinase
MDSGRLAEIWSNIARIRPLILHLSNFVVMNEQAHVALAIGASPLMTLHPDEVAELTAISQAVVINIGTPTDEGMTAMREAGVAAAAYGRLLLLDPVGYGASALRTSLVDDLLSTSRPKVIKGNHGELAGLAGRGGSVRGVDSVGATDAASDCRTVADQYGALTIATGPVDYVSDGGTTVAVHGGVEMLTRLTGTGCWLGSVVVACILAAGNEVEGAVAALVAYGIAAEKAHGRAGSAGVASFRSAFIDALGSLEPSDFADAPKRIVPS